MFQLFAKKQKVHYTFCIFISNSNRPEVHPRLLLSGHNIYCYVSVVCFFRALSLTVITKYGRTGMAAVINIVSAAVGLVVLWIMKMFTCFLKKCHISQWSRLISIVCNKYTYQYLQCHMLIFYHKKIYNCQTTFVLSFFLHAD